MGRFARRTGAAAFAAPILLLAGTAVAADGENAEIEALKQRLAEVEARLAAGAAEGEAGGDSVSKALEKGIPSKKGSLIKFYGILRIDAIFDDSTPNNTQTIGFVRPEDPTIPGGADKDDEDLTIHPRLTRFGLDLDGGTVKDLHDAKLTGKLEVDFYNNALQTQAESRAALRMRHAWLQLDWGKGQFLGGQTNDLIAPLWPIVNPDLVNWGAGNLGDRRPQFRYTRALAESEESKASLAGMAGLTGAIDNQNLDTDGIRDGEASAWPTLQVRGAWAFLKKKAEVGVWGHYARESVETAVAGEDDRFTSSAIGLDVHVPYKDVYVKAEAFRGHNLDDVRGGIFQGVDPVTGEEVQSQGGWLEVGWKVKPTMTVAGGFSQDKVDSGDIANYGAYAPTAIGARERNRVVYAAVNFNYDPVEFGFHYLRWSTQFKGARGGLDNRFQFFIAYNF
jgi:hypothetical protein